MNTNENTPNHLSGVPKFFAGAFAEFAGHSEKIKVLDFGCGRGQLVSELRGAGYEAYGCDHWLTYDDTVNGEHLKKIEMDPYRIPFADNEFDVVVSTSVLEHAQNTEECFMEINRVLKPGGHAMHILPGKWYLPKEPHIYVPLVSWLWPNCPKWWFKLWAYFGIRNEFQGGMDAKTVADKNYSYYQKSLCYHTSGYYHRLGKKVFGNVQWPMTYFLDHSEGGFAKLARKLPFKKFWGFISREFRMGFLVTKKAAQKS